VQQQQQKQCHQGKGSHHDIDDNNLFLVLLEHYLANKIHQIANFYCTFHDKQLYGCILF